MTIGTLRSHRAIELAITEFPITEESLSLTHSLILFSIQQLPTCIVVCSVLCRLFSNNHIHVHVYFTKHTHTYIINEITPSSSSLTFTIYLINLLTNRTKPIIFIVTLYLNFCIYVQEIINYLCNSDD